MFAKKTLLTLSAGALLAGAVPAFADHDNGRNRHRAQQRVVVEQHPVVERRVVTERHREPVYAPRRGHGYDQPVYAPRRGYGYDQPVYAPQPVYGYGQPVYSEPVYGYGHPGHVERDNTMATIGGAAIGAFIGSQMGHGHNPGAIAAGAILGGIIGSNF